jgi:hypothetical protein
MRGEIFPALASALFEAAPGSPVGPVPLTEGFGVARLLRKVVGADAEFEARRSSLAAYARKQVAGRMKGHVIAQLRETSKVTLDEAFLRSIDELEPTDQELQHVIATVAGRPLRYGDILDGVRAIRANGGHMGPSLRIAVASQEVDSRLLQQVAAERGFLNAPEVVAARADHEQAAVGYAALMSIMDSAPPPTERDIADYFQRNAEAFGRPFAQVLPRAAIGAAREKRQAKAVQTMAALRKKASISIDRGALERAARPRA